jgi:hypothetical protein
MRKSRAALATAGEENDKDTEGKKKEKGRRQD